MHADRKRNAAPLSAVLFGAGLIGRFLGPLVAPFSSIRHWLVIDRDTFTPAQAPVSAGRPKAVVLAEAMRLVNPDVVFDPIVADLQDVPLGLLRSSSFFLTALDSLDSRISVNAAFTRLGVRFWVDGAVQAPSLLRISVFNRRGPCFACCLTSSDYSANVSYPCRPGGEPPPTNSPEYLASLCASFLAAELARLLRGDQANSLRGKELVYDLATRHQVVTSLSKRPDCGCGARPLVIRDLGLGPSHLSLADLVKACGGSRGRPDRVSVSVPGKKFARRLACECGFSRDVLGLMGRFRRAMLKCPQCAKPMFPQGFAMADQLRLSDLPPKVRAGSLAALGFRPHDIIHLRNHRSAFIQLSAD